MKKGNIENKLRKEPTTSFLDKYIIFNYILTDVDVTEETGI